MDYLRLQPPGLERESLVFCLQIFIYMNRLAILNENRRSCHYNGIKTFQRESNSEKKHLKVVTSQEQPQIRQGVP